MKFSYFGALVLAIFFTPSLSEYYAEEWTEGSIQDKKLLSDIDKALTTCICTSEDNEQLGYCIRYFTRIMSRNNWISSTEKEQIRDGAENSIDLNDKGEVDKICQNWS
jgi:hypothetical protein